ncbi:MAG: hypothetical protein JSW12_16870 [Deltaproteobacteria bacterium]|nr:MAG: hypothetical protein JSW12_16870 [Deltaproteobacteria bacterium]
MVRLLHVVCLEVKPVGKPDAVAPHVRFDERGWETGPLATAPVLDSTGRLMTPKNAGFLPGAQLIKTHLYYCYPLDMPSQRAE